MSQSLQLAPFDARYRPFDTTADYEQYDPDVTKWNSYRGETLQQAVSPPTWAEVDVYQNTSGNFTPTAWNVTARPKTGRTDTSRGSPVGNDAGLCMRRLWRRTRRSRLDSGSFPRSQCARSRTLEHSKVTRMCSSSSRISRTDSMSVSRWWVGGFSRPMMGHRKGLGVVARPEGYR